MRALLVVLFLLAAGVARAQVQANFYAHREITIGPYVMYAVQACNGGDGPGEIQGVAIWRQAKDGGLFTPQLTSVVLQEKDFGKKISKKAWILRGLSWGSAGVAGLVGTKALGNLSLETGAGKAVMAAAPTISLGLGIAAEAVEKVPEKDVDPRVDAILPGEIKVGPHICSPFYIMWGIPLGNP